MIYEEQTPGKTETARERCLNAAKEIVLHDRNDQYGEPEDTFRVIAAFWTDYLRYSVSPKDVCMMMALLKIARCANGRHHDDNYIDLAGYAACAMECAEQKDE